VGATLSGSVAGEKQLGEALPAAFVLLLGRFGGMDG